MDKVYSLLYEKLVAGPCPSNNHPWSRALEGAISYIAVLPHTPFHIGYRSSTPCIYLWSSATQASLFCLVFSLLNISWRRNACQETLCIYLTLKKIITDNQLPWHSFPPYSQKLVAWDVMLLPAPAMNASFSLHLFCQLSKKSEDSDCDSRVSFRHNLCLEEFVT